VRDHLLTVGHIVPDRLFLAQESTASKPGGKGPRVFLSLQ
jgi:hypothetical protein